MSAAVCLRLRSGSEIADDIISIRACCAIPGADAASGAEEAAKKTVIELDQPLDLVPAYALPMPCPVLI